MDEWLSQVMVEWVKMCSKEAEEIKGIFSENSYMTGYKIGYVTGLNKAIEYFNALRMGIALKTVYERMKNEEISQGD